MEKPSPGIGKGWNVNLQTLGQPISWANVIVTVPAIEQDREQAVKWYKKAAMAGEFEDELQELVRQALAEI